MASTNVRIPCGVHKAPWLKQENHFTQNGCRFGECQCIRNALYRVVSVERLPACANDNSSHSSHSSHSNTSSNSSNSIIVVIVVVIVGVGVGLALRRSGPFVST